MQKDGGLVVENLATREHINQPLLVGGCRWLVLDIYLGRLPTKTVWLIRGLSIID